MEYWYQLDFLQVRSERNLVTMDEHIGWNGDVIGQNGKIGDVHQ
jgi:hypothetical protein